MAQQTPFTTLPNIALQTPKRFATTTKTNELAKAINRMRVMGKFGPNVNANPNVAGSAGKGQYQGMCFTMRTNNVPGWDFPQFIPPLDE